MRCPSWRTSPKHPKQGQRLVGEAAGFWGGHAAGKEPTETWDPPERESSTLAVPEAHRMAHIRP